MSLEETSAFFKALTKSPQLKVLSVLVEEPNEELTKSQIAQKAGIGRTTLYRIWEDLEKMKAIVPSKQVGAVTLYKINLESSIVQSILNIKQQLDKVENALSKGLSPLEVIDFLSDCMREIGDKFARLELFLTDLMMAGDVMKAALEILLPKIPKDKALSKGRIVIGTVKGDIHEIGKNIVAAMLTASGFEVYDLGKDVPPSRFLEEAEKVNANIIGASALMTTTMPALKDLIDYVKAKGLRSKYKIIVGGGPVTKEYAEEIGADAYAENAVEAVKTIKNLIEK